MEPKYITRVREAIYVGKVVNGFDEDPDISVSLMDMKMLLRAFEQRLSEIERLRSDVARLEKEATSPGIRGIVWGNQ